MRDSIRILLLLFLFVTVEGCTTTPSIPANQAERARIVSGDYQGSTSQTLNVVVGFAAGPKISDAQLGFLLQALMDGNHRQPTRKYRNITAPTLYDLTKDEITKQEFNIVEANREKGLIVGKTPEKIVKTILLWQWKRTVYLSYEIHADLEDPRTVSIYLKYWAEEKPPLSTQFIMTELSPIESNAKSLLLTSIDSAVTKHGGVF